MKERIDQTEKLVPRVLNKLTLCVYPMTIIVSYMSSITGLDKYNLSEQTRFDQNTIVLLNSFLSASSTSLLDSHNGDSYDFPLLKAEMQKIGNSFTFPIMCADSYLGIKDIFKHRDETSSKEKQAERKI